MLPMTDDQIHARGIAMQDRLDDARALLIGRTILRAEDYYLPGQSKRGHSMHLDNGLIVACQTDDEGNCASYLLVAEEDGDTGMVYDAQVDGQTIIAVDYAQGDEEQGIMLCFARIHLSNGVVLCAEGRQRDYLPGGVFTINGKPTLCNC